MSEATSHSPEATKAPQLAGVPEAMQLDTLDAVVEYRKTLKAEFDRQNESGDYSEFKAQRLEEMLADNGLHADESDPQATEDYERAKFLYNRLLDMNSAQWYGVAEGGERSEREDVAKWLSEQYADRIEPDQPTGTESDEPEANEIDRTSREHSEALQQVDASLASLIAEYSERVAERSKRMIEGADRKSTRLNSSHTDISRMPSSA